MFNLKKQRGVTVMVDGRHEDGWLDQLRQQLAEANQQVGEVQKESADVAARLHMAEQRRDALAMLLRFDDHPAGQVEANLTIRERLAQMALENGGLVRTDRASQRLADIGLYPSKQDAGRTIFTVMKRAKDFERVAPGVWRYTGLDPRDDPREEPPPYDPREERA